MRIVHAVGWYFPDSIGGTEVYVAALARHQCGAGMEVAIAAPQAGLQAPQSYVHDGVRVFRYPVPLAPTRDEVQGRVAVRGSDVMHAWLREMAPDVLHVHSLVTGLGLREIDSACAAGAHVVLTHHLPSLGFICQRGTLMRWGRELCDGDVPAETCGACALHDRGIPRPLAAGIATAPRQAKALARYLPQPIDTALSMTTLIVRDRTRQRDLDAMVDCHVALNEHARRVLVANGADPDRVEVNRLGVGFHAPVKADGPAGRPLRIGYVGRFHPVKGIGDLLRAFEALPRAADVQLEIRGPRTDHDARAIAAAIEAAGRRDPRIRLADPVPVQDVPAVLVSYDVLCCPSRWFENGPTIALEAMAVGTPVIATTATAVAELMADGASGRLVPVADWRALAAVLKDVTARPADTIDSWRRHLPPTRTMQNVADDYGRMYARLLAAPERHDRAVHA